DGQIAPGVGEARGGDDDDVVLGEGQRDKPAGEETGDEMTHMKPPWRLPRRLKWLANAPGRSPDSRAMPARLPALARRGSDERLVSLTVAGAVEALHLVPEHLAATAS